MLFCLKALSRLAERGTYVFNCRPTNPVKFLGEFLLQHDPERTKEKPVEKDKDKPVEKQ
jgi:hypothetical protein